ncbi:MAG: PVC-type heme-binding CxxCH protein [Planctomycetota bacterium]|nr:PVC-type heme-binding CxxCH protein [Planctomycetota bacterium]
MRYMYLIAILVAAIFFSEAAPAQNGDRAGETQNENWRQWDVPPAPVLSPEQALQSFQVAPGFHVELVASEPQVVDPIAIAWDEKGRLWAVELRAYMRTVDGDGETDPLGQVVVLEDRDGDGYYEDSTVFLDRLVSPRAIAIVEGGVLVAEPPHLWYCQDLDGDLRSDRRSEVARYGDPNPDVVEHTESGLLRTVDNWYYNSKSRRRFRFDVVDGKPTAMFDSTAFRGQWGIAQDDQGRLYFNHNSTWVLSDPLPTELLLRNSNCGKPVGQPGRSGHRVITDESTWPVRMNTGINRGYQPGMLREDGRLRRNTSAAGLTIFRSHRWGDDWNGVAFVAETTGNLVAAFRLREQGSRLTGEQLTFPHDQYVQQAFLGSTDERFRPVDVEVGPDGNLYVVDIYRGVVQHRQFVTSYLRKQVEERKLEQPVGLGRIWRIVADDEQSQVEPLPLLAGEAGRIRALNHPVGWVRDQAQRLLVEAGSSAPVKELKQLVRSINSLATGRLHALWTLSGLAALDGEILTGALQDHDELVRRTACRIIAEPTAIAEADVAAVVTALAANTAQISEIEKIHRVLALGTFPDHPEALAAILDILRREGTNAHIRMAALSGWKDYQVERIGRFFGNRIDAFPGREALLRETTRSALRSHPSSLGLLLDSLDDLDSSDPRLAAILGGIKVTTDDKRWKVPVLAIIPPILERDDLPDAVAKDAQAVITRLTFDPSSLPEVTPWTEAQRRLASRGAVAFASSCALCHGPSGTGQPGLGPSLIDSPWLLGEESIPIRLVLDGLSGPVEVDGEIWDITMPGHRESPIIDDEGIAAVLTWARRQWGHGADPIDPKTVTDLRRLTADRTLPWTVETLKGDPR